ncbi:unnamed protein product [Rhizophagus irregularis]|nr:unnamed protein product [Rhizophagus irregularis]
MIISGIVTATLRTVNHMIIYLIMNISFNMIIFSLGFYNIYNKKSLLRLDQGLNQALFVCINAREKKGNRSVFFSQNYTLANASLRIIAFTMIKGVRMESNRTMFVFYVTNLILYGFYIYLLKNGLFRGYDNKFNNLSEKFWKRIKIYLISINVNKDDVETASTDSYYFNH